MKAGKLAIQPWLSCRYAKNTFMDESCYKVKYSRSLFIQRNKVVKTDKKKRQIFSEGCVIIEGAWQFILCPL